MPDELGNKDFVDQSLEQLLGEAAGGTQDSQINPSTFMIENLQQAIVWSKDPVSRHSGVTKDLTLANLNKIELQQVRSYLFLCSECERLGLVKDAETFVFLSDMTCNSSLAAEGFAHKRINVVGREIEFKGNIPGGMKGASGEGKKPFWRVW